MTPSVGKLAPSLMLCVIAGCGTQVGNPIGSGADLVTGESSTLNTLVNAAFLQTIDGMNMGDYAYSRIESRVSTDRSCEVPKGSKFSLSDKAETRHSVIDDSGSWSIQTDLNIVRNYQDAWTQNNVLLACDPATRTFKFNYTRLQQGNVRLQSQVSEELTRSLNMADSKQKQTLKSNITLTKTGQRTLEFVNYLETGREVVLDAQLKNELVSKVTLEDGQDVTMQLQERFPVEIAITLDANQQWSRYLITRGQQEYKFPDSGETLRLEFRNVIFRRESGCIPVSGQMSVTVDRPGQMNVRYSINFQPTPSFIMQKEGGNDQLFLTPFACVLKER